MYAAKFGTGGNPFSVSLAVRSAISRLSVPLGANVFAAVRTGIWLETARWPWVVDAPAVTGSELNTEHGTTPSASMDISESVNLTAEREKAKVDDEVVSDDDCPDSEVSEEKFTSLEVDGEETTVEEVIEGSAFEPSPSTNTASVSATDNDGSWSTVSRKRSAPPTPPVSEGSAKKA